MQGVIRRTPDSVQVVMLRACPAGVSISDQIRSLRRGMDVVVGTPGRIIDLIDRGTLELNEVIIC